MSVGITHWFSILIQLRSEKQTRLFKCLIAAFLSLSLCVLPLFPALASDVVFLGRSAIGLEPPGAMIAHSKWPLLYDDEEDAMILVEDFSLIAVNRLAPSLEKPFSDYGEIGDIPGARMEGPVQHLKLPGGIEAYLIVYSDMRKGSSTRHWLMFARNAELFAKISATASVDSEIYTDAKMQVALQSLQFREAQPWE